MLKINGIGLRIVASLVLIAGLLYMPVPVFSQQESNIQNLILNGGFEQGFQGEFGVGFGWGGFSNGNAVVGWNADTWDKVVIAGESAQLIEIKNATERDRYAGIYQTVPVVPGQQYKLTINGLIRSSEGDVEVSDFGYRLQYAVDYNGGTTWELIDNDEWHELPWDEQPLQDPSGGAYRFDTFETTITARGDKLTLFIRGWKKWINNGSGIYNLDEVSLVGPAPDGFTAPEAQLAAVGNSPDQAANQLVIPDASLQISDQNEEKISAQSDEQAIPQVAETVSPAEAPLPISGHGQDDSVNYVLIIAVTLLLVLIAGATKATMRRRNPVE